MDASSVNLLPKIILILFLTLVNAFFAQAEMAMVSVNKNKIKNMAEKGNSSAKTLLKVGEDQTKFLSTIQVGITLAGFFSSGSAATSITVVFGEFLRSTGVPYAETIAFIVVTFILSYITLVFGELVPKRLALQNAETIALRSAKPIAVVSKIATPFVKFLSASTTGVLKLLGKYHENVEEEVSEEEIKSLIRVGQQQGVINTGGEKMMISIMDFDDTIAREIMTPRTSVYMVEYCEINSAETVREILKSGYTRVPVFRDTRDHVLGTIHIKDLFRNYEKYDFQKIDPDAVIQEAYFIPETKYIDDLLKELQQHRNYMAIIIDEYGGFSGIVTIEDIVEEIVGEIEDEHDRNSDYIIDVGEDRYLIDGAIDLDVINRYLDTKLSSDTQETLSGLMIEHLGYLPEDGDEEEYCVEIGDVYRLHAVNVKHKRFDSVELEILDRKKGLRK